MVTVTVGLVLRYACTLGGSVIGIAPFMYLERVLLSLTVPLHSLRAGTPCSSLHSQSFQVSFSGNITNSYSATPGSLLHRPIHVAFTLPRSSASWHLPGLGLWPVVVISTLRILLSVLLLYLPGKAWLSAYRAPVPGQAARPWLKKNKSALPYFTENSSTQLGSLLFIYLLKNILPCYLLKFGVN